MPLGLGLSFGRAGFSPLGYSGCKLWCKSTLGITFGTTSPVVGAGTTVQAVTLSGTPTASVLTILIQITGTGVRGTATFRWSVDGVNYTTGVTTAATTVLGSSGITVNWPLGTYTNGDTYSSTPNVSTWADQSTAAQNFTQATDSKRPAYLYSDLNGRPGLQGNSGASTLLAGATLTNFISASAFTIIVVRRPGTLAGANANNFNNQNYFGDGGGFCSLNQGIPSANPTTGCIVGDGGNKMINNTNVAANTPELTAMWLSGGVLNFQRAADTAQTLACGNVATLTSTMRMFQAFLGLVSNATLYEVLVYNNFIGAGPLLRTQRYLGNGWGVTTP